MVQLDLDLSEAYGLETLNRKESACSCTTSKSLPDFRSSWYSAVCSQVPAGSRDQEAASGGIRNLDSWSTEHPKGSTVLDSSKP